MKHLLSLALLVSSLSLTAQNVLIETRYVWRGNLWQNAYKKDFQYDNNQNKTLEFGSQWNNESLKWENNILKFHTYNELGKETEVIEKTWNLLTGEWVNSKKYNYTYSGNNQVLLAYKWVNGVWIPNEQFLYTYNVNNEILEIVNNYWDTEGNLWKIENKEIYEYIGKGKLSKLTRLNAWPFSTELENSNQTEISYNNSGLKSMSVYKNWDKVSNQWINSFKTTFTYNANGFLTEEILEQWNKDQQKFELTYKYVYDLNSKGEILSASIFNWDEVKQEWKGTNRQNNQLNEQGFATESIKQNFHPDALEWLNSERITKVYSNATGMVNTHSFSFEVYPNPAKDKLNIKGIDMLNCNYEILALDGKLLMSGSMDNQAGTIDISKLNAGFYLLNINSNNGQYTQKLIIE